MLMFFVIWFTICTVGAIYVGKRINKKREDEDLHLAEKRAAERKHLFDTGPEYVLKHDDDSICIYYKREAISEDVPKAKDFDSPACYMFLGKINVHLYMSKDVIKDKIENIIADERARRENAKKNKELIEDCINSIVSEAEKV